MLHPYLPTRQVYHCFGEWDGGSNRRKAFTEEYSTHYLKEIKDLEDLCEDIPDFFEELKRVSFAEAWYAHIFCCNQVSCPYDF